MVYGRRYAIEYEGLTRIYFTCEKYGHQAVECPRNKSPVAEIKNQEAGTSRINEQHNTNANLFGPWMMSAHVWRIQEKQQKRMQHQAKIS